MYANEILFVDKFLSKLLTMGVTNIPFKTEEYRNGVRAMKTYYENHINELDENVKDIRLLFICDGEKDFANAIMAVNGDNISLRNPSLERATILMSQARARMSLEDDDLNIPDMFLEGITAAFCEGAHCE